jgi:isoquinoline 1-oxidoreductase beta subunit
MNSPDSANSLDRRTFMQLGASAAGGLLLSLHIVPRLARAAAAPSSPDPAPTIGLFVRIEKDGTTFIGARSPEIGQGVKTSLPMIIAEEMDADWSKVRVEQLPFGIVRAPDGTFTWKYGEQGAGGSTNIPDAWADLRHTGARVRQVLLAAAGKHWNAPVSDLHTEPGVVKHKDGRILS